MGLVDRAKNILVTPKTEWNVVAGETATLGGLLGSYVLPLAAIPAAAALLSSYVYTKTIGMPAIMGAVVAYLSAVLSYVICTYVVDLLANTFKSEKNIGKSAQLVAYASTASWIAGILTIIPVIGILASFAGGIYAIYLMYLGVGPVKKTPEDQKVVYMVVIFVALMVISFALAGVLGAVLLTSAFM